MSARQITAEEHANQLLRQLGPALLAVSCAADRGDRGKIVAHLLMARAAITETLNSLEREVRS